MVITIPSSFHFENTKVVPWNYDSTVYIHGKRQDEPLEINESVVNIVGTEGMARSGRVFASTPLPEKNNVEASTKSKCKQVIGAGKGQVAP